MRKIGSILHGWDAGFGGRVGMIVRAGVAMGGGVPLHRSDKN